MKIEVRFRGLESSEMLREHVARRVQAQLSRFGRQLTAVLVRITDINGPRGGLDKRCQVTAQGPRFSTPAFEGLSGDAYEAVDLAVERISRAVGRDLERARSERRAGRHFRRAS